MSSNLPPGVSDSMIPGNSSEDIAWEQFHEYVDTVGNERGLDAQSMRLALDIGLGSLAVLQSMGYVIMTNAELRSLEKDIERESFDEGYQEGRKA